MTKSRKYFSLFLSDKSIWAATVVSGITASVLLIAFCILNHIYPQHLSNKISQDVNKGILAEFNILTQARDRVFEDEKIQKAVLANDGDLLVTLLQDARKREPIGPMSIVDKDGFVISRTRYTQSRGDNIFLETAIGRRMASGRENVSSIEQATIDPREILFITGRFFKQQEENQGALFATYLVDDAFAERFASTYLGSNTRVAFYTNQYGISGSNISVQRNRDILDSNIHANPDWSSQVSGHLIFKLENGQIFMLKHIQLKGAESAFGGVVVFVPLTPLLIIALAAIVLPFLIFILVCLLLHRRSRRKWAYKAALALGLGGVIGTSGLFFFIFQNIPAIKDGNYPIYNSTIRLQPGSGVYNLDFEQKVSILLNSGGEAINVIGLTVMYDPDIVEIKSIDTENSLCQFFIQNKINTDGSFTLECGLPNPGFKGRTGIIADIYLKGKKKGVSLLRFSEDTQVLANDGLGTNVLRIATGGSFAFEQGAQSTSSLAFNAISSSHPNAERWYRSKNIGLSWLPTTPVRVTVLDPMGQSKEMIFLKPPGFVSADTEGSYKIFVNQIHGSGSTTLAVNIDASAPNDIVLEASETSVVVGDIVRFETHAKDLLSGLQRTSYLRIDDRLFFPIGPEIHIPFYERGVHRVTLRAYDKAGNYAEDTVEIVVRK